MKRIKDLELYQKGILVFTVGMAVVFAILYLMSDPELMHKGNWLCLFGGLLLCIVTALSVLFADEIFRWNLSFQIQDADQAEPSDWEMTRRRMAWTVMVITTMVLFIMGLG